MKKAASADTVESLQKELKAANDRVEELTRFVNFNSDTGLPVRHKLIQRISAWKKANPKEVFAYGLVRLDSTYQKIRHQRDRMRVFLFVTAQRIQDVAGEENVYQSDRLDEFLIFLPGKTSKEDLKKIVKRIKERVAEPQNPPAADLSLTCDIGIACYPEDGVIEDELMENAEIALKASEEKKSSFLYTNAMGNQYRRRREVEAIMLDAIKNGLQGFRIVYQPLVNTRKELIGCEALMRWSIPKYGDIPPIKFIPLAESNGQILILGLWILYNALQQIKTWRENTGLNLTVSVNASTIQLKQPNYISSIRNILKSLRLPGEALHIEVTETALAEEPELLIIQLKALRKLGVRIMLDDFGTGYSGLSYLSRLPLDTLKVAKEFVDDMEKNEKGIEIIKAVKSIADSFGLSTLAEGVETQKQFDSLVAQGCDFIQGYLISPPLPAEDFEAKFFPSSAKRSPRKN